MADEPKGFDPDDPSTWTRFKERTEEGGVISLSRWPEGYRLFFNGEIVWRSED